MAGPMVFPGWLGAILLAAGVGILLLTLFWAFSGGSGKGKDS